MADEKYYEQKLTNATVDVLLARKKLQEVIDACKRKLDEADRQADEAESKIRHWLARNLGIDLFGETGEYIDFRTGKFRPGKWMPHCIDPELKKWYAKLEEAITIKVTDPAKTYQPYSAAADAKTKILQETVAEVRRIFGDDKARQIAARAKAAAIKITGVNF